MKKIIILFLSIITIKVNAQLQTVTNGTGNNITTNPLIINGDGTNNGVYIGHGRVTNTNTRPNGLLFTNTALGMKAIGNSINLSNTSGNSGEYNTAVGFSVLQSLNSGMYNSSLGYNSLNKLTSGTHNAAFGNQALANNTLGRWNSAFGSGSLQNLNGNGSTDIYNSAFGSYALSGLSVGGTNTAIGYASMSSYGSGDKNTAIGAFSMNGQTSGTANICIGNYSALPVLNGSSQLSIGNCIYGSGLSGYTGGSGSPGAGNIVIGAWTTVTGTRPKLDINGNLWIRTVTQATSSNTNYLYVDANGEVKQAPLPQSSSLTNNCTNINYLTRSISSTSLGCSQIYDAGTGNVGIGVGSTPTAKLDIGGDLRIATVNQIATNPSTVLYRDATTGIVKEAILTFPTTITNSCTTTNIVPVSDASGNLACGNIWNDGSSVGIGTTAPTEQLHTTGGVRFEGLPNTVYSPGINPYNPVYIDANGKLFRGNATYALRTSNPNTSTQTQQEIDNLKAEINTLKEQIAELLKIKTQTIALTESKLFQNTPNPFNSVTKIEYFVTNEQNNFIAISNLDGKPIKNVKLNGKGKGILELNAGSLSSGTYTYSLYSNNILVDTKLMVISK